MNSNNAEKTRLGLAKMAGAALSTVDLETAEASLFSIIATATTEIQTQPVSNWLSDVRSLADRVGGELEKKLAWLDGKEKVATVAQKPVARTEPARRITNPQQKVVPSITQMVERGRENKPSATPGHLLDKFREVLNRPEPQNLDERPKYWREVRKVVFELLTSGVQLEGEDLNILINTMKRNLYALDFRADKVFFSIIDRDLALDLLFGGGSNGKDGVIKTLLQTLVKAEETPKMKGEYVRSCFVVLSCLNKINTEAGKVGPSRWASHIAKQVVRLNGPADLIAALEAVKVPSKEEEPVQRQREPRPSGRRQPLPQRKFHELKDDERRVEGTRPSSTENRRKIEEDLEGIHAAAQRGAVSNPFADLPNKLAKVNGNGSAQADSSVQ